MVARRCATLWYWRAWWPLVTLDHSEMLNLWFSTWLRLPVLTPRLKPGAYRRLGRPESAAKVMLRGLGGREEW